MYSSVGLLPDSASQTPIAKGAGLHGLLLLALLTTFRLNAMTLLAIPWSLGEAAAFLPAFGFVLAFESGWMLLERFLSRWPAIFLTLFWIAHLLLGALELVLEQFFLVASERITPAYLWFTIAHPPQGVLHFALATVDHLFIARALGYCAGLIIVSLLIRRGMSPARHVRRPVLAFAVLAGVLLSRIPAVPEDAQHPYSRTLLFDFLSSITLHPPRGDAIRPEFAGYEKPQVIGARGLDSPNVVVFVLESTRTDLVRPEPEHAGMPFVSSLLKSGVIFTNAYAGVTHTSKALSAIECGMYPRLTTSIEEARPGDHALRCLPGLLSKAGYATSFWQSAYAAFEHRVDLARNFGFQDITTAEGLPGAHWAKTGILGIDEQALVQPMLQWMIAHRAQPFFASALTVSTHHPYQAPGMPLPTNRDARLRGYRAAALNADNFVHGVVNGLRDAGLLDNTVILIVGDHGEGFPNDHPGYGGHDRSPFEEVTHVPLGLYGPRWVGPARVDTELRSQIDILPTILNLAGIAWTGAVPGLDLLSSGGHPTVFTSCYQSQECLVSRTGRFATIYEYGMHPTRVYDLQTDPRETHDLAATIAPADIAAAEHAVLSFTHSIEHYYAAQQVTEAHPVAALLRERNPMPEADQPEE